MLEMKSQCERCQAALPADLSGALICSYECTWCDSCAADLASTAVLGNCRASAGHYLRCVLFWGGLGVEECQLIFAAVVTTSCGSTRRSWVSSSTSR